MMERVASAKSIINKYETSEPTKKLVIETEEKLMQEIERLDGMTLLPNMRWERRQAIRDIQEMIDSLQYQVNYMYK